MPNFMLPEEGVTCDVVIPYHTPALPYVHAAIDSILNQQNARCIIHVIADAVDTEHDQRIRQMYKDAPNLRF